MSKRFAALYEDGSLNVEPPGGDLESATKRLLVSTGDDTTQIVEVELRVVRTHGQPKLQVVTEDYVECPCCGEHVWFCMRPDSMKESTAAAQKQEG